MKSNVLPKIEETEIQATLKAVYNRLYPHQSEQIINACVNGDIARIRAARAEKAYTETVRPVMLQDYSPDYLEYCRAYESGGYCPDPRD